MIKIIENIKIDADQYDLVCEFSYSIPQNFVNVPSHEKILKSYQIQYPTLERVEDGKVYFKDKFTFAYYDTLEDVQAKLELEYTKVETVLNSIDMTTADSIIGMVYDGQTWINTQ